MTETALTTVQNTDMATFTPDEIKRAGDLLGVQLDKASIIKTLIIQRDTGLSLARGEISIIPFGGKPTPFINKQGYLAYANRQPEYDGYVWNYQKDKDGKIIGAWCKVYRKDRKYPVYDNSFIAEDVKDSPTWRQMPSRMAAKTAIKRAHQAAFPVLNGLLMPEEVGLDESDTIHEPFTATIDGEPVTVEPLRKEEAKPAPKPEPKNLISITDAQKMLESFTEKGYPIDVFDRAKTDSGFFDKDMIMSEWNKCQNQKAV